MWVGVADDNYDLRLHNWNAYHRCRSDYNVTWDPPAIAPAEVTYGTALATTTGSTTAEAPEDIEGTITAFQ